MVALAPSMLVCGSDLVYIGVPCIPLRTAYKGLAAR